MIFGYDVLSIAEERERESKEFFAQTEKRRKEKEIKAKNVRKLLDDTIFGKQQDTNKTTLIALKYVMDKIEELEEDILKVKRDISSAKRDTNEKISRLSSRISSIK